VTTIDNTIDPNETKDRAFDWTAQLATGETIASFTVSIVDASGAPATNATVGSTSQAGNLVNFRLTGATGASGTYVYVRCRVTTSTGEILDDTWPLLVFNH
jgi:hypothetical protein